jgi:hypothetical protein
VGIWASFSNHTQHHTRTCMQTYTSGIVSLQRVVFITPPLSLPSLPHPPFSIPYQTSPKQQPLSSRVTGRVLLLPPSHRDSASPGAACWP